jgi:hypothetical protein
MSPLIWHDVEDCMCGATDCRKCYPAGDPDEDFHPHDDAREPDISPAEAKAERRMRWTM